jgi:hypothetical protein
MANNHTFSPPVEYTSNPEFDHAVRFAIDKRDAALMPVLRTTSPGVKTVSDDSDANLEFIRDQIVAGLFSGVPGARAQYVRDALNPASRGQGRGRDRR